MQKCLHECVHACMCMHMHVLLKLKAQHTATAHLQYQRDGWPARQRRAAARHGARWRRCRPDTTATPALPPPAPGSSAASPPPPAPSCTSSSATATPAHNFEHHHSLGLGAVTRPHRQRQTDAGSRKTFSGPARSWCRCPGRQRVCLLAEDRHPP